MMPLLLRQSSLALWLRMSESWLCDGSAKQRCQNMMLERMTCVGSRIFRVRSPSQPTEAHSTSLTSISTGMYTRMYISL